MRFLLAALFASTLLPAPAPAGPPDVYGLVGRMKVAMEPAKAGVRRLTFTLTQEQETVQVTVGEARKMVGGKWRVLLTTLAPAGARGTAYLVEDGGAGNDTEWFYLPYVRRVRKFVSPEAYSAFLNSDFTYADLGFINTNDAYRFLGESTENGVRVYKIQAVPKQNWYYSRWVTTIDASNMRPITREIYDSAGQLWKRQHWGDPTVVDGVMLMGHVSMEDLQAKSRTDIRMTGADYDIALPDSLFDPDQLPATAGASVWADIGK